MTAHSPATGGSDRILHLTESGGMYGIERMILALLPALQARGVNVALGCFGVPGTPGGAVGEAAAMLGIEVHYFGFRSGLSLHGVPGLAHVLARKRCALAHFHGYKATIVGGVLSRVLGTPGLATYHGEAKHAVGLDTQLAIETPLLRGMRSVIAVSAPIADELVERGVRPERVQVIPNGIPIRTLSHRAVSSAFTIAIVGRLVREKNVHVALEVVAALRQRFPALRVLIAGDGPYRGELERLARALSLVDSVTFLGFVPDVPDLLRGADAFVMPSQTEGMPMSLLEAMAMKVPIIATAVGSIPTVARDTHEALLVPPGDQSALQMALEQLLIDPASASARAERAHERFLAKYTNDSMADAYVAGYDRLLGTSAGPLQSASSRA